MDEHYGMLMSWPPHVTAVGTAVVGFGEEGPSTLCTPEGKAGASLHRLHPWSHDAWGTPHDPEDDEVAGEAEEVAEGRDRP